ncbi:hypothetical protein GCM10009844_05280 [Nocardioides koreensis]|uniref:Uncharacterized protein n=1 Tax=Nocardioides koreensis TaxID=433651 RepID=A0ABN2Z750_9ACTN
MLAGMALVLLVVAAALAGWVGRPGVVALALASVLWLLVNQPVEGVTLIRFSSTHGLNSADLAGLAGLVMAVVLWRQNPGE